MGNETSSPVRLAWLALGILSLLGPRWGSAAEESSFRRGDVNGDGVLSLTDPVAVLGHLFLGAEAPGCLDAADADDSGTLDLADAIRLLGHLFLGAEPPPAPGSTCGQDPTVDSLGCASSPECGGVFEPSVLHEIEITLSPEDLEAIQIPPPIVWPPAPEPWFPCTFRFDGTVLHEVGIRRKGNSTLQQAAGKYSFSVKFNEYVKGRRLHGLEKIILNNCVLDPTFLNEAIGYGMYRRLGLPAPLTAHALVAVNGQAWGIYLLKEAIDEDFLARVFGDGNGDANLYEGPGDLLPRDPNFPGEIQEPELKDEDQGRVRDDFRALRAALEAAGPDSFLAEAEGRIDMAGFILGWAVDSTVLHFDGYPGNYYLYHEPVTDRFVFIPHGMDQLFGFREWSHYDPETGMPVGAPSIHYEPEADPFTPNKGGGLTVRLLELEEGSRRFTEAVLRVSREGWDVPAILAQVDRAAAIFAPLRGAGGAAGADAALFESSVEGLRTYVAARKAYLETLGTPR